MSAPERLRKVTENAILQAIGPRTHEGGAVVLRAIVEELGLTATDVERIRACGGMGPVRFTLADALSALVRAAEPETIRCSFCGKSKMVRILAGPGDVRICNECADEVNRMCMTVANTEPYETTCDCPTYEPGGKVHRQECPMRYVF